MSAGSDFAARSPRTPMLLAWAVALMVSGAASASGVPEPTGNAAAGNITYVRPNPEAPQRRVGGASRGSDTSLHVSVLAPEQTGFTLREQPILYWFSSGIITDSVELTIIRRNSVEPVLEQTLNGGLLAGFHSFALAGSNVRLEPEVDYEWSVAVVRNPNERSKDILSTGVIRRIVPGPDLSAKLAQEAPVEARVRLLAESGIWYDALAEMSDSVAAHPDDRSLAVRRADLLQQVGLKDAAGFDRR